MSKKFLKELLKGIEITGVVSGLTFKWSSEEIFEAILKEIAEEALKM